MASNDTGSYKIAFSPDLTEFAGVGSKVSSIVGRGLTSGMSVMSNGVKSITSGLGAGLGAASSGLKNLSSGLSSISSTLNGISSKITTGLTVGVGAATVAMSSYVSQAITASDATDSFRNTLKFAGMSASEIDQLTKSTRKYADQTVYGMSDIMSMTSQLAANGVNSSEKLAEAAGNLNAVAGGTADTYKSVGLVITQTSGLGHLNTQNWYQLANAIPGASGKIMQALKDAGAYTGNFADALSGSKISADEFNAAIMKLGNTQEAYNAATSTTTFGGAWGNLEATIVGGLNDAFNQNKASLTGFINYLNGPALKATQIFGTGLTTITKLLSGQMTITQLAGSVYVNTMNKIRASISALVSDSTNISDGIMNTFSQVMNGSISFREGISSIFSQVKKGMTLGDLGTIGIGLAAGIPILAKVASLASVVTGALGGVVGIVAKIIPLIGGLSPVMLIIGAIAALLAWFLTQTQQGQGILTQMQAVLASVWAGIQPALQQMMVVFKQVWIALQPAFANIAKMILAILPLLTPLLNVIIGVISRIATIIGIVVPPIIAILTPIVQFIAALLIPSIKSLGQWVFAILDNVIKILSNFVAFFKNVFSGNISGAIGNLKNIFTGFVSLIFNLFHLDSFVNLGKYVVEGIWKGIQNGWSWLKNKVSGWIGNFVNFFRNGFKINSPSKLMAAQVGVWLPRGIASGVDSAAPELMKTVRNMSSSVSDAAQVNAGVNVNSAFNNGSFPRKSITSGNGNGGVVINQQVSKADSAADVYFQTKAAANGYFSRSIVPPREPSK